MSKHLLLLLLSLVQLHENNQGYVQIFSLEAYKYGDKMNWVHQYKISWAHQSKIKTYLCQSVYCCCFCHCFSCTRISMTKYSYFYRRRINMMVSWIQCGNTQRRTFRNISQWAWNLLGLRELACPPITAFPGKLKGVLHSQKDGTNISPSQLYTMSELCAFHHEHP